MYVVLQIQHWRWHWTAAPIIRLSIRCVALVSVEVPDRILRFRIVTVLPRLTPTDTTRLWILSRIEADEFCARATLSDMDVIEEITLSETLCE